MPRAAPDLLQTYRAKRDFSRTPEPDNSPAERPSNAPSFVIQKHDATRLHYDFRLEWDGVLWSWAVPKGPSLDPADKRMAVRTEDHPLAYGGFEGTIPPGQYGAGRVIVWDRGTWVPDGDPAAGLERGKLAFELRGHKLQGHWELVRMKKPGERREAWLLFKKRDEHARPGSEYEVLSALPDSVLTHPLPLAAPRGPVDSGAVPAPLPELLSPQLATLANEVPEHGDWIFEVKFDGYRLLTRIEAGRPRLITRGGHDWTDKMPALARDLAKLQVDSAWLDGEILVEGATGDAFNALQNAFDLARTQAIEYVVFDLPYFEGHDLRGTPLSARRELLRQLLQARPLAHVRFSEALGQGAGAMARGLLDAACAAGQEGLIAKRGDASYSSTRSSAWLKLKCGQRQEFVIGGFTERQDDASAVGSLILGVHDEQGRLRHAGSVGTGWDRAAAQALLARLETLATPQPPFDVGARGAAHWRHRGAGRERWVRPTLVAEVSFAGWTPAGSVRHAVFVGLRHDKPAQAVTREVAVAPMDPPPSLSTEALGLKITHPGRVIDADSGLTKLDLIRYYDSVAGFILPHLQGRPAALLRAPGGVGKAMFFQKHGDKIRLPGVRQLAASAWPGHEPLLEVPTRAALLGAAQMNVIEFHPWNASVRNLAKPDRMVFDLDPGEGVPWPAVQEAAQLTRALLQELGLQSWLKTSGGKGLHLVVPLAPRWDVDTVKGFSQAVVQHLAATIPARFVAKSGPANRRGRIFVDYLRNGEGATAVAPFSARARPGLGVSMPVAWEDLDGLHGGAQWTIANARDHLSLRAADPWAGMAEARQSLAAAMRTLGYRRPA